MSSTDPFLLSFKAGRVDFNEETKQATPKRGQGLIKVAKNPDDPMLFSFVWEPRGSHKSVAGPEGRDELLLFPGDAQWVHVKECTSGRVFALKFRSSGQNFVFWMQSPVDPGEEVNSLSAEDKLIADRLHELLDEESLEEGEGQHEQVEQQDQAGNQDIELPDADQPDEEHAHD